MTFDKIAKMVASACFKNIRRSRYNPVRHTDLYSTDE